MHFSIWFICVVLALNMDASYSLLSCYEGKSRSNGTDISLQKTVCARGIYHCLTVDNETGILEHGCDVQGLCKSHKMYDGCFDATVVPDESSSAESFTTHCCCKTDFCFANSAFANSPSVASTRLGNWGTVLAIGGIYLGFN